MPPYLVLHREEYAWPRMSPHAPVRSYRTVSPITRCRAGLFSVALVVAPQTRKSVRRPAVSGLAALWCSDFPLPADAGSNRPTCSHARRLDYSKPVLNTYSQPKLRLTEVFEADAEAVCPHGRRKKRYCDGRNGVRECEREEVGLFLIDNGPDHAADKREQE